MKIGDNMCETYNNLSIMYFFKNFLVAISMLLPILLMISATRDVLKNIVMSTINYSKPLKKLVLSLSILFISIGINNSNVLANTEVLDCWNNANIETLASLQDSHDELAYVPVVVEPIYIKNPYSVDIEVLKEKIQKIIGKRNISLAFYNPRSAQGFDINGDKIYVAASVSKLHAVLNVYDYAFENNINLDEVYMKYSSSDFQGGSGILQSSPDLRTRNYSLSELCEIAITESDNIAWNMIRRYMSDKRSNTEYFKDLVNSNNVIVNGTYAMTANWGVSIMKKIYYNRENNFYYDKLIVDMKNTSKTKIAEYLDEGITAHKTGAAYLNGYLYANDAAIIYSDSEYILTIFTKSKMSNDDMSKLIGEISLVIYEEMAKN